MAEREIYGNGYPQGRVMKPMRILWVFMLAGVVVRAQTPPTQKQQPQATAPQTPAAPVVSPEVLADHRVTFRFRGPNAKDVSVRIDGASKPLEMQKDEGGEFGAQPQSRLLLTTTGTRFSSMAWPCWTLRTAR